MINSESIQLILKKSEDEKATILENILNSIHKAGAHFAQSKDSVNELREKSNNAGADLINLLNGHIRRLETEKAELRMEVEELKEDDAEVKELREQVAVMTEELDQLRTVSENTLKEKEDAEVKLRKIQEQWERFTAGR